jgi:predicted peroxiredoxin
MAKKVVVYCGSDEPLKVFPAFMIGSAAQAMDMELILFFSMKGMNVVRKGGAERIKLPGAPKTLPEFINVVREAGAKLIACSGCFPIMGLKEEDLIEGVELAGAATFVDEADEADTVLTF